MVMVCHGRGSDLGQYGAHELNKDVIHNLIEFKLSIIIVILI